MSKDKVFYKEHMALRNKDFQKDLGKSLDKLIDNILQNPPDVTPYSKHAIIQNATVSLLEEVLYLREAVLLLANILVKDLKGESDVSEKMPNEKTLSEKRELFVKERIKNFCDHPIAPYAPQLLKEGFDEHDKIQKELISLGIINEKK